MGQNRGKVAVAIVCKTPAPGRSKTRLSPPLHPDECAAISACFIRDLSRTIHAIGQGDDAAACAVYTPTGSETSLQRLLPDGFLLVPQGDGDLGARLLKGTRDLLGAGFAGAILVNSDSPTLPLTILRQAMDALLTGGDKIVLSPALDGGYTLIGLSRAHAPLFSDMPWSTPAVYRLTLDRANDMGLPVVNVPGWYDVDDESSFRMLEDELSGIRPYFTQITGADAPATRQFIRERQANLVA